MEMLQRPFPVASSFLPTRAPRSIRRIRLPGIFPAAVIAAIMPDAPPPATAIIYDVIDFMDGMDFMDVIGFMDFKIYFSFFSSIRTMTGFDSFGETVEGLALLTDGFFTAFASIDIPFPSISCRPNR